MAEILTAIKETTANDIIAEALENIGAKSPDVDLTAIQGANFLRTLNFMLDTMSVDGLLLYAFIAEDFALTADQESYSIGDDDNYDFDTVLPEAIEVKSCYIRDENDYDYPLNPLTEEEYNRIGVKTGTGMATIPEYLYYRHDVPEGTIYLINPPKSGLTLHLVSRKVFSSFPDGTTILTFPAGYVEMLSANLSVRLAPKYDRPVHPVIAAVARESLAALQSKNLMLTRKTLPSTNRRGGILTWGG